ncbi:MAG: hypothetical protein ACI35P_01625 [Bacillus sp. (in: firmicutes)]
MLYDRYDNKKGGGLVVFFNKNRNVYASNEDDVGTKGIAVQITPVIIYVFVSEDGYIAMNEDSASIYFEDLDGNAIEAAGNLLTLEVPKTESVDAVLTRLGLKQLDIPIVTMNVKEA